jgi:hypothetical protein
MFASALLAISVAALASAFSASYAHQAASADRVDALVAGEQLLEQAMALPVQAADREVSILALGGYVDELLLNGAVVPQVEAIETLLTSASTLTASLTTTVDKTASTLLSNGSQLLGGEVGLPSGDEVDDGSTLDSDADTNGRVRRFIHINHDDGSVAASIAQRSGGELAWVSVTVRGPDGSFVVVRRLVHRAEGRR